MDAVLHEALTALRTRRDVLSAAIVALESAMGAPVQAGTPKPNGHAPTVTGHAPNARETAILAALKRAGGLSTRKALKAAMPEESLSDEVEASL